MLPTSAVDTIVDTLKHHFHKDPHGDLNLELVKHIGDCRLLNDQEIAELCHGDKPMISPFLEKTSGPGLISYGLSSFGYDARLSPEYLTFVDNPASDEIIDPKNFNPSLTEKTTGKTHLIPPHGFVLGSTMEYFRIPRDVLVICVGKSTYARCFSGDTTVAMADGTVATFTQLVQRARAGEKLMGLSLDTTTGKVVEANLTQPRRVGNESLLEIMLETGEIIRTTRDHKFIVEVGMDYVEVAAQDLQLSMKLAWFNYRIAGSKKIQMIAPVVGTSDVYCVTAPDYGNFFLGAGPCVSNCGLIVNVTPLEPGWEGQVTLELSNTTNIPSKIYGEEGICQFLFFKGNSCKSSYEDKSGKYMFQTGVTLPRIAE